MKWKEVVVV